MVKLHAFMAAIHEYLLTLACAIRLTIDVPCRRRRESAKKFLDIHYIQSHTVARLLFRYALEHPSGCIRTSPRVTSFRVAR